MQYNDDTLEGTIPEEKEELSLIGFIVFFCVCYIISLDELASDLAC